MITRALIRNFRCLASVDLSFEPLTILVGPNASGKSAVLAALTPGEALKGWNGWRQTQTPEVQVFIDGNAVLPHEGNYAMQALHLDLSEMRAANQVREAPILGSSGGNLTNAFATLTRSQQGALVEQLTALVPMYRDVVARPQAEGYHRLVFQDRWEPSLWYEPAQVSDGTILLLAFLLLQYQRQSVQLLGIEEPERGLHPYLVGELIGTLRKLAMGKLGLTPIQVVVATHSAELLEFAEPSEVRFLSRNREDGSTHVETAPTAATDWANAFREYQKSLGGMWLSGALGGVPGD